MEILYAPTRGEYLKNGAREQCVFCAISQDAQNDEKHYVFYRDEICFGVMNLYPYSPGHLMFIPHLHLDSPHLLEEAQWNHLSKLVRQSCEMLYAFGARGINTGINIKSAGGAGIPEHLHWHLVPRFERDTNFMTTIAQTRIYGCQFDEIFTKIQDLSKVFLKS
ncbi:HIT family protein [Helicobacter kayseriensis]|uniref:HIT family protein n=1 Tax=Helicobacter kayseriensis TaxID=2905877 RepID=UPI001E429662|nr:HIT domain-containing protein [Helicobacter kayseriensis]MCE3046702.1 HIT domain-containing protein [Helicobacter kayseriensis]MCE3047996.1 HIT domain-containing protein [Helicobacter kayseriensis]